jgi:membrane protein
MTPDRSPRDETHVDPELGRDAEHPSEIPARGWRQILKRTFHQIKEDRIQMVAAALAYYALLAAFPLLIALISIYGLMADPAQVEQQLDQMARNLPPEASSLISSQLSSIVQGSTGALGWAAALSILGALWSTSSGVQQLIRAINIAYDEGETRGFVRLRGLALALTVGLILFLVVALGLIVAVPPILSSLELPAPARWAIDIARFVLLAAVFMVFLAAVYRFAPDRDQPRMRWVSWGAVVATVVWLAASVLFTLFVTQFADFQKTYGTLAGLIILLLWFFLTGFVVLGGAELNSEIEHQTARDTTRGEPEPMGRRGAMKADTLPEPDA